jgi:hypothetical protein
MSVPPPPRRAVAPVLRRIGSWAVGAATLLIVINLGGRIMAFDSDSDIRERPFAVGAGLGETARARTLTATGLSVRGAAVISDGGPAHDTGGVWVIVRIRATSLDEPMLMGYAALRDARGREFWASNRVKQPFKDGRTLQPGIPVEGEVAFEVPRDAATHVTLLLAERPHDHRMDSMIEVDLGSRGSATVDGWVADRTATTLVAATVVT